MDTERPDPAVAGDLAVRLGELTRTLQGEDNVQDTLDAIVAAAVDTVPGARYAGISVVERRRAVSTRAATDDLVHRVDQAQYDTGQGPCLDAIYEHPIVHVPDMATELRWPDFRKRALDMGVRSMLSLRLYVRQDDLGGLNLYSPDKQAFDEGSEHVGLLFAAHAAIAMSEAQHSEQLSRAVVIRDLIGQAKGILMERHKLTADEAFALLVRVSQRANTKLVDIAEHLTRTGELKASGR